MWFKVDDGFFSHPKVLRCGLPELGLWIVAGTYSSRHLTDGFISEAFVKRYPQGRALAARLVEAELWHETEWRDERGWWFHDWNEFQPSAEDTRLKRKRDAERKKQGRESRWGDEATPQRLDANTGTGTGPSDSARSPDGIHPESQRNPRGEFTR